MFPVFCLAAHTSTIMKDSDQFCMVKSRFAAGRLKAIVKGLTPDRRALIIKRGWGVLLDICDFSTPKGLLEWMISKIDPELGEFRNSRNNTSIVFNKQMVVKVLGLPHGTRPVVLLGPNEQSPYHDFYKMGFEYGKRAPIHVAQELLSQNLDEETWLRTFFLVVVGTYFYRGPGNILPLEYLGSLGDSKLVCEYDWGEHIFQHTMSGIQSFQKRLTKSKLEGITNFQGWIQGCLPWVAVCHPSHVFILFPYSVKHMPSGVNLYILRQIVYMDHLDFPESTLSTHRINYALPRASHVTNDDFKFVMKHDKSRLTLNAHTYGARPVSY